MLCVICLKGFEQDDSRQKYCTPKCKRKAKTQKWKQSIDPLAPGSAESIRRIEESNRIGEISRAFRVAQVKLEQARKAAIEAGVDIGFADRARKFAQDAVDNVDNVLATRVHQFATQHETLHQDLVRWAYVRGLTEYDVDAIWARLIGKPKPIVIAPEEPSIEDLEDFARPEAEPSLEDLEAA